MKSNYISTRAGNYLLRSLRLLDKICPYTQYTELLVHKYTGYTVRRCNVKEEHSNYLPFLSIQQIEDWLKKHRLFLIRPGIQPDGSYCLEISGVIYSKYPQKMSHPKDFSRRDILKYNLEYLVKIKV